MATATFIEKDQDFQNETTIYWFELNIGGAIETVGIKESGSSTDVVHSKGSREKNWMFWDSLILDECTVTDEMRAA